MFQAAPPFKLALAAVLLHKQPQSPEEVATALAPRYAKAPFFTLGFVEEQLHSLQVVGILKVDAQGRYALTRTGEARVQKNL